MCVGVRVCGVCRTRADVTLSMWSRFQIGALQSHLVDKEKFVSGLRLQFGQVQGELQAQLVSVRVCEGGVRAAVRWLGREGWSYSWCVCACVYVREVCLCERDVCVR